jgi:hypothetical protein
MRKNKVAKLDLKKPVPNRANSNAFVSEAELEDQWNPADL